MASTIRLSVVFEAYERGGTKMTRMACGLLVAVAISGCTGEPDGSPGVTEETSAPPAVSDVVADTTVTYTVPGMH